MPIAIIIAQGLIELLGLGAFIAGYFIHIWWLMILGGCLVVLDDVFEISMGILNPIFPLILSVVLVIVISPWYVGIFWASALFKVLGVPTSLKKVFTPRRILSQAIERSG